MTFERKPGSVFVTVPKPEVPTSEKRTPKRKSDAESRLTIQSPEYLATWDGIAEHMKSLFPTPAAVQAPVSETTSTPVEKSTSLPCEPAPVVNEAHTSEKIADNVRCYRLSHFDGSEECIYDGVYTDDIPARCQLYADKSGYLVRLVCSDPHELKAFHPRVLREALETLPTVDPDAPPQEPLEKLGWSALRDNGGMFLDDRLRMTRRGRKMNRRKVVAWLNHCSCDGFFLKIRMPNVFGLDKPIPKSIESMEGAVEWVYRHSYWKVDHLSR